MLEVPVVRDFLYRYKEHCVRIDKTAYLFTRIKITI